MENGLLYHPPASPRDWTADDEQREVLKHAGGRTIQEQDADAFVWVHLDGEKAVPHTWMKK